MDKVRPNVQSQQHVEIASDMARPREEETMNSDLVRDVQLTPFELRPPENPSPIDIPPIRES